MLHKENRFFLIALFISLFLHIGAIFASDITLSYLNSLSFKWLNPPQEKSVVLEFVDSKKEKDETMLDNDREKYISQQNSKASSEKEQLGDSFTPELEGDGITPSLENSNGRTLDGSLVSLLESPEQIPQKAEELNEKEKELEEELEDLQKEYDRLKEFEKELLKKEKEEDLLGIRKLEVPKEERKKAPPIEKKVASPESQARMNKMLKNLGAEVEQVGKLSLETKENILAPYLALMRGQIFEAWFPFVSLKFNSFKPSKVVVQYRVYQDGSVPGVYVLYSDGEEFVKDFSRASIKKASPFPRLPNEILEELDENYLAVVFTFLYN